MAIPKHIARKVGLFHSVSPADLVGLDEYAEWLEAILHDACAIGYDEAGKARVAEIRQTVTRLSGLKIEVYPNEHAPPHFHVKSPNVSASFCIQKCEKLEGTISAKDMKKVKFWHQESKSLLISTWNKTRPTSCVVGQYIGT